MKGKKILGLGVVFGFLFLFLLVVWSSLALAMKAGEIEAHLKQLKEWHEEGILSDEVYREKQKGVTKIHWSW